MTEASANIWMIGIFVIGYILITLEHLTKVSKTTIALMMAILCWIIQFKSLACSPEHNVNCLGDHLNSISQVVFFLLGALTIVEIISAHQGFKVIAKYINVASKVKLLWVTGFIAFILSSVLDNLTTTIVLITLLRKLISKGEDRLLIGSGIVIAANAGGAWTPIGDVTTTMLWIGGQLSTGFIMRDLFFPSVVCMLVSYVFISFMLKGEFKEQHVTEIQEVEPFGGLVFYLGIGALIFVPIFKMLTGLPPFVGVLFGLSVLWIITDLLHKWEHHHLKVPHALSRIDLSSTLFFFGILLCIDALDAAGLLTKLAAWLDIHVGHTSIIALFIGLASAVIDNVPLVAASMGMYDLAHHPKDSQFWEMIAYCAGTGGSILIIGSAAGVVFMGLEKVDFFWYCKRITIPALIGYLAGFGTYLLWVHYIIA